MPDERDFADLYSRVASLEAWMRSAHWSGDPVRNTPPDEGPKEPAPDASKFRRKKAEQQAQEAAFLEFTKSPAGEEISKLFARVIAIEAKFARMHGRGGIRVTNGEVIEYVPNPRKDPDISLDYEEIELTFCDVDDVQHTGTFLVKIGSIVPPL